ncbi:replication protein A 70 kDa DNA-binding subunit B isoform X2 [Raphanus sativus]|uniref:Replication protein A 70 kDa DNA-binding subunit B isoform X2 n=1 Tax=Raphanus sativus TaxID=3726 RepID=A0A6J0MZ75_RAPSA|nr:replication protein A 70 kDa DNA-binding subunit B isoform X2 [Raphanus sativus]
MDREARMSFVLLHITSPSPSLTPLSFPSLRTAMLHFRFYSYEEFEANCDAKGDLYDVVGHMKLVNGQSMIGKPTIEVSEVATSRRMVVHIQRHEGPVMKLYLWNDAAIEFCQKFRAFESPPSVVLVTTVNPKLLGGTLALSSMSSSRVFFDGDVQPTRDYLAWLVSHPDVANQVNAEVVTKREAATIGEIFAYMKQDSAKPTFFECTATIDDVVHDAAWYYIGCSSCKSKATRGATSLMCGKCGKNDITGEAQYLAKLSVYDKSEEAVFVLLGDAGSELTGKPASELANGDKEAGTQVPVPQALLSTVGQTHHFSVKVSEHNLSGKSRSITVTKILHLPAPPTEEPLPTADGDGVILEGSEDSETMGAKELGDGTEFGNNKRIKRGD